MDTRKGEQLKEKKVCITGGAGMIGASLTRKLLNEGYDITIIDNLWRGNLENLLCDGNPIIDLNNNFHEIDLSDANQNQSVCEIFSKNDMILQL